jgi:hypothetical protein
MAKKITLEMLDTRFTKLEGLIERGYSSGDKKFAAIADDIADIKRDMATKDQIIALHTQVNSIETEIRGMKHTKLQSRVADLEEEVFGESRS